MANLNYIFFDEFKRLEKLCGESRNVQHGITNYIDDMKAESWNDYRYVPNWDTDLNQLVRLRHIRNQLAHTEGAFYDDICTQNDIDWIQTFYKRILNQSDPLAILYQNMSSKIQVSNQFNSNNRQNNQSQTKIPESKQYTYYSKNNNKTPFGVKLLLVGFIVLIVIIFLSTRME